MSNLGPFGFFGVGYKLITFFARFPKNMFSFFFFYFLVFNKRSATGARLKHQFSFIKIPGEKRREATDEKSPDFLVVKLQKTCNGTLLNFI